MKMKYLVLLVAQMLSACASVSTLQGACTSYLEKIVLANAEADAEKAFRSGQKRVLGIQGYTIIFPGVKNPQLPQRIGYKIMEGTSDAISDKSCDKYQSTAIDYVARYNIRILQLLESH
jgi:uncharacterized protein YceK